MFATEFLLDILEHTVSFDGKNYRENQRLMGLEALSSIDMREDRSPIAKCQKCDAIFRQIDT